MKKIRMAIFIITFFCLFFLWNRVITIDRDLSTNIENDLPVDYVLLGSSHIYHGVNPLRIWNETGYIGYNLGSDLQIPETSYLCLKEFIDSGNTPKVVFFDFLGFTIGDGDPAYNLETSARFPLSPDKIKYLRTIKSNERLTMLFPFLQFHSRWKDLNKNDFTFEKNNGVYSFMGYLPFFSIYENDENEFYTEGQMNDEYMPCQELLDEFERIYKLCNDNGIELVVIKTPTMGWTKVIHSQIEKNFTNRYGLDFIDFNHIHQEIGFDYKKDFADPFHVNDNGSIKITEYLTKYIDENYDFTDKRGSETAKIWDQKYNEYLHYIDLNNANSKDNMEDYIKAFTGEDYLILKTYESENNVKVTAEVNAETIAKDTDEFQASISFSYENTDFYLESTKNKFNKSSKIQVDLQNYSKNDGNVNIVVYDRVFNLVVSTRSFCQT